MKRTSVLLVRLLALLGLGISVWLLFQKLNGTIDSIAGCGDGSDCANVLGSRWSQFFLIPVSALSALLYIGLLILSFRPKRELLFMVGILLLGAALWFTGLQIFVLGSLCPWCLTAHSIGFLCGLAILLSLDPLPTSPGLPIVAAGLMLGILVIGQVFGPQPTTYVLSEESFVVSEGGKATKPVSEEELGAGGESRDRVVRFFGGKKAYSLNELPHVGPFEAPHVMVKYFDYLCGSCRDMHGDIKALQASHPKEVTVIMLPSPLDRSCNPSMKPKMKDHAGACEISRLALASWRVEPESFEKIHDELFDRFPVDPTTSRKIILEYIPEDQLDAALSDPWIDEQLKANFADFGQFTDKTTKMPKLLIKDESMMHGLARSTEGFIEIIHEVFDLE